MPVTLEALADNPATFLQNATDPATGQPYRYERIDADTYTLTATFDLPSPSEQQQPAWNRDGFFKHGAGEQSFRLSAPKQLKP